MKKVSVLFVAIACLFGVVLDASASSRETCVSSAPGAIWLGGKCRCPENFQLEGEVCKAVICKDTPTQKPAAPKVVVRRAPKQPAVVIPPTCMVDKTGVYSAATPDEKVSVRVTCEPGTSPIKAVVADCENCGIVDGAGTTKSVSRLNTGKKKAPVATTIEVKANPSDKEVDGRVNIRAETKDGSSVEVPVSIKWPAKKVEVPTKSTSEIACERDGGKFDKVKEVCICPEPMVSATWTDASGNLHFCKSPVPKPVLGKDGKDGRDGVTTVVYKGDASHFDVSAVGVGAMIEKSLATGFGLKIGGSWAFGPGSKYQFNFGGGMIFAPTPEYTKSGMQVRNASGDVVKNNTGFLASAGVTYAVSNNWELGGGFGYLRLGQHWSGTNAGKGTIEGMFARADVAYYLKKGEVASTAIVLTPMLGAVIGGRNPSARTSAGFEVAVQVRL